MTFYLGNKMSSNSPKIIHLDLLTSLDPKLQMHVREIRNEENIRRWMYSDYVIEPSEHRAWIDRLQTDDRQIVFVVLEEGIHPIGVVSVNAIDRNHRKTDWAFYLTETARGGLGSALEYEFINFVFGPLKMEKLNCEVIENNDAVVNLHKKFLFKEEGFRRQNILKHDRRTGVHFLGLTKEDWLLGKQEIKEKYKDIFDRFSITINWKN
jgi:UDP-4-amino-4,6-dideoxy-N-acetyl-beta-L-altrosamine N-acetyltransferase